LFICLCVICFVSLALRFCYCALLSVFDASFLVHKYYDGCFFLFWCPGTNACFVYRAVAVVVVVVVAAAVVAVVVVVVG
jgi:hypothetical protein